ncbi:cobalt-zinc-cadmium resistance protein CzcB [bacterium BMS3Abin04]|nr:cobalt-zinc-cadmium resistance protein CzcB [bacterium BMS3Abin04]
MNKNNLVYLAVGAVLGGLLVFFIMNGNSKSEITPTAVTKSVENSEEKKQIEIAKLSPDVMKEFGVEIADAKPGNIQLHLDLTGEVVPNPYKVAHIIPRFGGIVKKIYKKIGDRVKAGEVIATIESNESLVEYKVKSSIKGTILELHMTPGELIGDRVHAVKIADLSSVWAELNVYQKDLLKINIGENVLITSPGSDYKFKGRIFYVSPTVNEVTRTSIARVKLGNVKGFWKPGLFITGRVKIKDIRVPIAVPKTAIGIMDGQSVVFIQTDKGFIPQPVKIGYTNEKTVQIISGLKAGQKYVAKNGFVIKSEIEKSTFADED